MAHGEGHAVGVDEKMVSPVAWYTARYINGTNTVAMVRPTPALEALGEPCCSGATGVSRRERAIYSRKPVPKPKSRGVCLWRISWDLCTVVNLHVETCEG